MQHHGKRILAAATIGLAGLIAAPSTQADPIENTELLLHWDFEGETYDADTNQWTITDKSGKGHNSTAHGNYIQVTENVAAGSHVVEPAGTSNPNGIAISSEALNGGFADGLIITARVQFATLPGSSNAVIVRKGSGTTTTWNLYGRDGQIRFSIADGTASTGSIISGALETGTIYELTARFSPELDQISLTINGGNYDNQTWTDTVTQDTLFVSDEAVSVFAGGGFDAGSWVDDVQIIAVVPEPGSLSLLSIIAAAALGRRRHTKP